MLLKIIYDKYRFKIKAGGVSYKENMELSQTYWAL
jgi:hypothetical protein